MKLIVNGKENVINEMTFLGSFIGKHCPCPERVIVELNGQIVKRDNWENHVLKENDRLELITFVGGG